MYRVFKCNISPWISLQILFLQFHIQHIESAWPISNSSGVQLLGLFENNLDISESQSDLSIIHSRAMFQSAMILSQRYQTVVDNQFIGWQLAFTNGDAIHALSSTCQRISTSNTVGVVGPAFSREAHLLAAFAVKVNIPLISYSATDPTLSDRNTYPTFHRTISSDANIALTLAQLFVRYNWTSCIIIYQNDAYGTNGADVIRDTFMKYSLTVISTLIFDTATLRIRGNLKETLLNSPTRIVILWAQSSHSSAILQSATDDDVAGPQFLWILSSKVSLHAFRRTSYEKLIGMLSIEATVGSLVGVQINSTLLLEACRIWQEYEPETFPEENQVDAYALFTFDATWSLIKSLQRVCSSDLNVSSCLSIINSTFCFHSYLMNSNLFLTTLQRMKFLGVSGPIEYHENTTDRTKGIFFLLQNIQPSSNEVDFVPVLKWTDSTHWQTFSKTTIIIWPGNTLTPPTGYPKLVGVKLRIGVIKSAPFLMAKDNVDASGQNQVQLVGYIADFIDRLQSLTGFIPEIILAPDNKTYGAMVRSVMNNEYDIVVGDVIVTSLRREFVDFSIAFYDNTFSVIIQKSSSLQLNFFAYLKPFSSQVWLVLLVACLYAGLLFWILERQTNAMLRNESILSSLAMSIWYSIGTLLGYGVGFTAETGAGRLLTLALYILCLALVATYTANLASDLTLLKSNTIISGVNDLKNGKIPFNRIGIVINSAYEDYFLREISLGSRNFYPLPTLDSIYPNLLDGHIDASIMDTGLLEYAINTLYCNLTLVGTTFNPTSYAIVVPKGWIYSETLDINILLLKESGFFEGLVTKWFRSQVCPDSSESVAITIISVGGLFSTFAVISLLAVLLFLWTRRVIIKKYVMRLIRGKYWEIQKKNMNPEISLGISNNFQRKSNSAAYF